MRHAEVDVWDAIGVLRLVAARLAQDDTTKKREPPLRMRQQEFSASLKLRPFKTAQQVLEPTLDGGAQFAEMALEEMISGNEY